jgi:predicted RNA-binding protein associated with RNAse of E/G family
MEFTKFILNTKMEKIHHKSGSGEFCPKCGREFMWFWKDAEEKNGYMETKWTFENICLDCITLKNGGRPPLGLNDLAAIRKRKITKEQYYKEKGF